MTRNVVFLVKNGIGFGHIRRAVLLARAVQQAGTFKPIVISQAGSLDAFHSAGVGVVNFPLLHRTPSAVTEDRYTELLDEVVAALDPAVAVEDTYPDPRYLGLHSLAAVPRVLLLRRLDGASFDQLRTRGALSRYSEILIAQSRVEFDQEGHSGETLAAVEGSGRFRFIGNIHAAPSVDNARAQREQVNATDRPLVVVSAGAGGDQMADGFCDRLFAASAQIADKLHAEGHPARFVFVTGPYYAGHELKATGNVTVHRYFPDLAALLCAADVAVLKPGNNVLSETLLGSANLVLVPDASFMEGLDEHAARTVARYGGVVTRPCAEPLEHAVRAALAAGPRKIRTTANQAGIDQVLTSIARHTSANTCTQVAPKYLALMTDHPDQSDIRIAAAGLDEGEFRVVRLSSLTRPDDSRAHAVLVDSDPPALWSPQTLADNGVRLLLLPDGKLRPAVQRWLRLAPPLPALLPIPITIARPHGPGHAAITHAICSALSNRDRAAVLVDFSDVPQTIADQHVAAVREWLRDQPLRTTGLTPMYRAVAAQLLDSEA